MLAPDLDQAKRFLLLLDEGEDEFVFLTFDDNKERKSNSLIHTFHGTLDQHAAALTKLQQEGAGVFVTVNHSTNGGRKKADIGGCRAIFREADHSNLPELPLEPHIKIESSPGKFHEYLLLEKTADFATWDGVMKTMVDKHGSDPNAKDRSRVLRLPGFYHQKNPAKPHMVRIIRESGAQPYSLDEVAKHFPPMLKVKENPAPPDTGRGSKYGLAALAGEIATLAGAREGGRNDQLNKAAFSLAQLVAGGELEQVQVETALLSAAVSLGLTEAEAQTTIKSGMDAGAREPRTVPASTKAEEWPEHPVSLDLPPLPTFTADDFPPDLWEMVSAVSKAKETPTELAGMLALSVVATTCQRWGFVEPEPGYREPLNIWTLAALGPGNRKSSVEKAMTAPLTEWEIEQAQIMSPLIRTARLIRDSHEARLKELQKQYAKATDENKRQGISKQMEDLSSGMVEVPVKPQIIAQDVTPERLGALLAIHGERMSIFSAEGGIFDNIAGRYSNGTPNLDIFLQSHSGDTVRVDRASREPIWLKAPALTMGLCVQPDVIKSMASKPGFKGRGLLARFLYALPKSPLGQRKLEAMPIPHAIEFNYKRKIHALLGMSPPEIRGGIPVIKLSPEAWGAWKNFQREVEKELFNGGEYEHMQDWAGKLPGVAARIAGLFHCFVHAGKQPNEHQVSLETINRALSLAEKVSRHTLAVYDLMEADGEIVGARKILVWITRGGIASFTGHQCHSALKGTFQKRAELDPALQTLIERGYIRKLEAPGSKGPGRPAEAYSVHPAIQSG